MEQPSPEEVAQTARSLAMSPSLTNGERLRTIEWLRLLLELLRRALRDQRIRAA